MDIQQPMIPGYGGQQYYDSRQARPSFDLNHLLNPGPRRTMDVQQPGFGPMEWAGGMAQPQPQQPGFGPMEWAGGMAQPQPQQFYQYDNSFQPMMRPGGGQNLMGGPGAGAAAAGAAGAAAAGGANVPATPKAQGAGNKAPTVGRQPVKATPAKTVQPDYTKTPQVGRQPVKMPQTPSDMTPSPVPEPTDQPVNAFPELRTPTDTSAPPATGAPQGTMTGQPAQAQPMPTDHAARVRRAHMAQQGQWRGGTAPGRQGAFENMQGARGDFLRNYQGPLNPQVAYNLARAGGNHLQQATQRAQTPRTGSGSVWGPGIAKNTIGQKLGPAGPTPTAPAPRDRHPTRHMAYDQYQNPGGRPAGPGGGISMTDDALRRGEAIYGSGPLTSDEIG